MNGRVVYDAVAAVGHRARDAGGQERLAEARCAGEQHVPGLHREILRILPAVVEIPLHEGAGTGAYALGILGGIEVETEIFKRLPAAAEQARQLLFLLLPAQLAQARAHLRADIAAPAALGAHGRVVQIAVVKIPGLEDPAPLPLEREILFPDGGDGLRRVLAALQGRGHQLGHGAAQLVVDLGQTGIAGIGVRSVGGVLLLALRLGLLQPRTGAMEHLFAVCHLNRPPLPACGPRPPAPAGSARRHAADRRWRGAAPACAERPRREFPPPCAGSARASLSEWNSCTPI